MDEAKKFHITSVTIFMKITNKKETPAFNHI